MENTVVFGLEKIHVGEYDVASDGTVTLGAPYHIPGAVDMTQDPESEQTVFNADNRAYYMATDDNGYSGELEMAVFPDEFKVRFLNYSIMPGGGVGKFKDKPSKKLYMAWEFKGDKERRRGIMYNIEPGMISREFKTTEQSKEPVTAKLPYRCLGDVATGLTKACYKPGDAEYGTLFSNPPLPVFPLTYKKSTDTTVNASKTYYTVAANEVVNPVEFELGTYYEKSGTTYALTEDTVVNLSKTYYQLRGTVVASPTGNPSSSSYYEEMTS